MAGCLLLHPAAQAATQRAALVIEHGPSWPGGKVLTRCVEFGQEAITGLALLELAGFNSGQPPQVYGWGGGALTVCQINGEPRQVPDRCFGPISGPNWSDWQATAAGWTPRSSGATSYSVRDGDLEGWTYATGYGTRPPGLTFNQVCPPAAPAQAASARPTAQASTPIASSSPAAARPVASASQSAAPTPSMLALAPSLSPSAAATAIRARQSMPPDRGLPPTLPLLATTVAILSALLVWNLRRRGS